MKNRADSRFSLLTSRFSFLPVFVSAFLPWIDSPIGPDHYGTGRSAAVVALCGLILHKSALHSGRGIAGASGISLCLFFLFHLAFFNPFLCRLTDENAQYAQILKFSETCLPPNLTTEPDFQSVLRTRTVWNLLETSLYFSGSGLWVCMAGSFPLLISGFRNPKSLRFAKIPLLVCIFIPFAVLFYGIWIQYIAEKGDQLMISGDYAEAVRMYESALKTASPAIAERIYLRIGEAFVRLGDSDHPAALYYQGRCYEQNRASDSAIPVWLRARETAAPLLKTILSRHIAWTYIKTGLLSYQKKAIFQAIILWEKALVLDSDQIQAAYYLSRAYFDQESYRKSIEAGRKVLSLSRNRLLNADTLANMGDSYWKLHDFAAARSAYQAALKLDPVDNPRIVKALGGT